jgi:hypothetical protein
MKRTELVEKLIKEGFSEKTLVKFSDNQLIQLASRMLSEEDMMISKKDPQYQQKVDSAKKQNKTIEAYEELKGNQKVLDKNDNGKIDSDDFAILNKEKKGEVKENDYCDKCDCVKSKCKCKKEDVNEVDMGLTIKGSKSSSSTVFGGTPKKKSTPKKKEVDETEEEEVDESLHGIMIGATKEKLKKDLGRDPEDHEVEKELGKFVDSWKKDNESKEKKGKNPFNPGKPPSPDFNGYNKRKEKKEGEVEEGDYHNERSKKALEKSKEDFPQLKNIKKCDDCGKVESKCKCKKEDVKEIKNWVKGLVENKNFHSFTSKNEIMELIQTKLNESDTMVQHGPKVKKGHNGIPEFMSYDAIASAEPKTAPSKPAPSTKPGTRPTPTRREDPRKTPFQPGPGTNPKPKAKMAEEKKK